MLNSYNNLYAEVAQLVEQRTENPRVPSSILGLGTILLTQLLPVNCLACSAIRDNNENPAEQINL